MEAGVHSISEQLQELGHQVIVTNLTRQRILLVYACQATVRLQEAHVPAPSDETTRLEIACVTYIRVGGACHCRACNWSNVPKNLAGLRTMFNAFHHFAPRSARLVLESAVQARQPVGIFEIPERSLLKMVLFLFTPIFVALATPFMRPFRWKRLLWTYVVPLIPLTCWWDGLVSACRAVSEMLAMTQGFDDYDWKADRIGVRGKAGYLTHLLGIPRSSRI